ncbi:MAG: phage shock protein operon transcriptional activator [Pseudomonadota bacterium]
MQTNIIGESVALTDTLAHLSHLATINRPILVLGERGTGKELAAERLHFLSTRWDAPFIKVNCAAMAETLLESELFGHEAGAFTGATRSHVGRFERAHTGTLFLDEVGTMSSRLQEKLLRLIEYGEFERVGGQKTIAVDVRVIAATNADLIKMVSEREFRADLLDRLSFDVVHMPALRVRGSDVDLLAQHFAIAMSAELGWEVFPGFTAPVRQQLAAHHWPGNVRELKNVVERSLHRWDKSNEAVAELVLDPFESPWEDLPEGSSARDESAQTNADSGSKNLENPGLKNHDLKAAAKTSAERSIDFRAEVEEFERTLLEQSLARFGYNQRHSAEQLKLSYDQLRGLMRKHDLRTRRKRIPR